jgi:GntP family gluconate:H+ symporter
VDKPEDQLPPFWLSIMPVILPVVLISLASFTEVVTRTHMNGGWAAGAVNLFGGLASFSSVHRAMEFIGNKNIALLTGAVISMYVLARQKGLGMASIAKLLEAPLTTAGVIILITSAGGAFGLMLRNAGVGDAIKGAAEGRDVNLLLLSYGVALVLRVAQGSATVSMLTTSAMIYPIMADAQLSYSPIYVFLATAFGSFAASWMNDSGFWVVSKLSGFTEKETLRSWTVLLTVISFVGLLTTLLCSVVIPLK